jgi:DNA-binding NtrC family response regulator
MGVLGAHDWPGNVRELKNALEYAAATSPGPIVEPSHLPDALRPVEPLAPEPPTGNAATDAIPTEVAPRAFPSVAEELRALERQRMLEALEATGGVQTRAAQRIGMPLRTFAFKLKQYRIGTRGKGAPP